jgi:hypothetical protein
LEKDLEIPPESLLHGIAELIAHPPPPRFDWRIISDFRRFSQICGGSSFHFCGQVAAMVSKHKNVTTDVTVTQTL